MLNEARQRMSGNNAHLKLEHPSSRAHNMKLRQKIGAALHVASTGPRRGFDGGGCRNPFQGWGIVAVSTQGSSFRATLG